MNIFSELFFRITLFHFWNPSRQQRTNFYVRTKTQFAPTETPNHFGLYPLFMHFLLIYTKFVPLKVSRVSLGKTKPKPMPPWCSLRLFFLVSTRLYLNTICSFRASYLEHLTGLNRFATSLSKFALNMNKFTQRIYLICTNYSAVLLKAPSWYK